MRREPSSSRRKFLAGLVATGSLLHAPASLVALPPRPATLRPGAVPFRGADISYLPELEELNVAFLDGTLTRDPLEILRARGINLVRLRVWNNPAAGYCSVPRTLALAARARALGMHLLVNFHYSDSWADPGQQNPPAAWSGLSITQLEDALADFTGSTIAALVAQGTPPAIVQIGNEVTAGMLWPLGANASNWTNFARLFRAGRSAAKSACPSARIMLHIDRGGDNSASRWFYDNALANQMRFDIIGLSYYPWWHGSLAALQTNLADLASRYARPIHIVETAYPWSLSWADAANNFVWQPAQCLPQFPPTPAGQTAFTAALLDSLAAIPRSLGEGLCWWAPEAVAAPGFLSPWENLTLFDFAHAVLPAAAALGAPRPAAWS
jgi:arabinogalactan endo-1,4-beta-galactosidase